MSDIEKAVKAALDEAREYFAAELSEVEARARAEERERFKDHFTALDNELASAKARLIEAQHHAALAGKVKNPEYALFKAAQNPDRYMTGDGINAEVFLKDHPDQRIGAGGPAPTTAGGGLLPRTAGMNQAIRTAAMRAAGTE